MPIGTILATVAAYVAVALLLISLNLTSRWRWWIKGGAIVVTGLFFLGAYLAIASLLGWATNAEIPPRFQLVATRVIEPDPATGNPGALYLWVEELDENNVPNGRPRSYRLPYTAPAAEEIEEPQNRVDEGEEVQGMVREQEPGDDPAEPEGEAGAGDRNPGGAYPEFEFNLAFDNLAPVVLPDKGVL